MPLSTERETETLLASNLHDRRLPVVLGRVEFTHTGNDYIRRPNFKDGIAFTRLVQRQPGLARRHVHRGVQLHHRNQPTRA